MKKWLLLRQDCGFNGRPHKPADTCYSFWIGGALQILDGAYELVDHKANRCFLEGTQHKIVGGFAKYADHTPGKPCALLLEELLEQSFSHLTSLSHPHWIFFSPKHKILSTRTWPLQAFRLPASQESKR